MSLKVELGLFNLDCTDYHAILGVPVNIDPKEIRKQYLKIARRLHPDSFATENEEDRKRAAEYLSKLVNPAYEKLSQEKNYADHLVFLRLKGEQATRQPDTVMLVSDLARRLASATGDIEQPYRAALRELAEKQYEELSQTLELIGQISELNLIYLMRTAGKPPIKVPPGGGKEGSETPAPGNRAAGSPPPPPREKPTTRSLVEACLRRGKERLGRGDSNGSIQELKEGIKLALNNTECNDPHSECHAVLGEIYLQNKQSTMAKIHFNQALKLNSNNEIARAGLRRIDPTWKPPGEEQKGEAAKGAKPGSKGGKPNGSNGGFLGGLFGGKKK